METNGNEPHMPDDEMVRLLTFFAEKWTLSVVGVLLSGPRRFSMIRRAIPGVSQKMLTQTLREMERNGLVARTIYPQVPPRVDYALTPLGMTMCDPIKAFKRWIDTNRADMIAARAAFDQRTADEPVIAQEIFDKRLGILE